MAIECVVCSSSIGRCDGYLSCRSICNRNFHCSCVNISVKQLARMKEDGSIQNWSCSSCSVNIIKNMPHDGQSYSITCDGVGGSDGVGDAGSSNILQLTRLE
ncbi:hypothetical protein QE152_g40262 [Popillia japonica]|uniref:PHD-type domain-containing protein n=1 Tax=Popillia japonica TaxID=7064 RepID=A0AAW1HRY8_POPJA